MPAFVGLTVLGWIWKTHTAIISRFASALRITLGLDSPELRITKFDLTLTIPILACTADFLFPWGPRCLDSHGSSPWQLHIVGHEKQDSSYYGASDKFPWPTYRTSVHWRQHPESLSNTLFPMFFLFLFGLYSVRPFATWRAPKQQARYSLHRQKRRHQANDATKNWNEVFYFSVRGPTMFNYSIF